MALTQCPECAGKVSDKAVSCPHCGYPLSSPVSSRKQTKSRGVKRLPNGYGTIRKLSGKRRKPFLAGVNPRLVLNEETKKSYYDYDWIGYYEDRGQAMSSIIKYHDDPYDITSYNMTLQQLYDAFTKERFPDLSDSRKQNIELAWSYCSALYDKKVINTKVPQLKQCINNATAERKTKTVAATDNIKGLIKSLLNLMYDYAFGELDIIQKNYARSFELTLDTDVKKPHIIFTDKEIELLSKNLDIPGANIMYIGIYSGWRPDELCHLLLENIDLENHYFSGGNKTSSSKNRVVPIHPKIYDLVKTCYENAKSAGSSTLFVIGEKAVDYKAYHYRFGQVVDALGLDPNHRPHDTRHTFSTLAKRYKVDEYARRILLGHKIKDVTDSVYTHMSLEWYKEEISKIS